MDDTRGNIREMNKAKQRKTALTFNIWRSDVLTLLFLTSGLVGLAFFEEWQAIVYTLLILLIAPYGIRCILFILTLLVTTVGSIFGLKYRIIGSLISLLGIILGAALFIVGFYFLTQFFHGIDLNTANNIISALLVFSVSLISIDSAINGRGKGAGIISTSGNQVITSLYGLIVIGLWLSTIALAITGSPFVALATFGALILFTAVISSITLLIVFFK